MIVMEVMRLGEYAKKSKREKILGLEIRVSKTLIVFNLCPRFPLFRI